MAASAVKRVLRTLLGSERMDELPPPSGRRRRSFLRWLAEPETLPLDDAAPGTGRKSVLRVLLAPEALALDEPPAPAARRAASRGGGGPAT